MKKQLLAAIALLTLAVTLILSAVGSHRLRFSLPDGFEGVGVALADVAPTRYLQALSTTCAPQASLAASTPPPDILALRRSLMFEPSALPLERFRRLSEDSPSFIRPKEEITLIDPTNYGERFLKDLAGRPALREPIVVLHETVGSAFSTLNFFRTAHPDDNDQASYHALVNRDGTIVYLVPPDKRAYGAGNSVFVGTQGMEAVQTNPTLPGSVNNFAYHISLESPPDGRGNATRHSGYTEAQYQSLAWLVAKTGVPDGRITTHQRVDRSGSRMDPRSFDTAKFTALLQALPRTQDISIQCTEPSPA